MPLIQDGLVGPWGVRKIDNSLAIHIFLLQCTITLEEDCLIAWKYFLFKRPAAVLTVTRRWIWDQYLWKWIDKILGMLVVFTDEKEKTS
jgi:hypothetical protein